MLSFGPDMAFVGPHWDLAGLHWLPWVLVGLRWPSWAFVGFCRSLLAYFGLNWPVLAAVGSCQPVLAFMGPSCLHWLSLACVDLC